MRATGTAGGRPRDLSVPVQGAYPHAGVFDHAGPVGHSLGAPSVLPSAPRTASATLDNPFSRLNGRPTRAPVNASPRPRGSSTH